MLRPFSTIHHKNKSSVSGNPTVFVSCVQLLRMFFRQQDELRRLKEELSSKDVRIRQLELELNNLKNVSPNNV